MAGPGSFLAVSDVSNGVYQSTYTSLDDSIIYVFGVEHKEDLDKILLINKDYSDFMIASLNRVIYELGRTYQDMVKCGRRLYNLLTENYKMYYEAALRLGYTARKPQWADDLAEPESVIEPDLDRMNYYMECARIPIDVMKSFYGTSNIITVYQIEDQSEIIGQLNEILKDYAKRLDLMLGYLIDESDKSLFGLIATHAIEIVNTDGNGEQFVGMLDNIVDNLSEVETFFENRLGRSLNIDRKHIEEIYRLINTGTKDRDMSVQAYIKYSVEETEKALEDLKDSYRQILDYSEIDEDRANQMQNVMLDFINLKDRLSTDDYARKVRKQLSDMHYELYKAVFLKAYHDKNVPKIIDMFLKYGYADERLLTKEQLLSLYFLEDEEASCNVYNIKQWLTLIYEGKKEPSKNEFDQEYTEMLISMKSRGMITEGQFKEYCSDNERKLEYEIQNLLRYNNRITSGHITTFVPVLHRDVLTNMPDKSVLTPGKIKEVLDRIMEIDFSVFD